jgi:hypothetical protein
MLVPALGAGLSNDTLLDGLLAPPADLMLARDLLESLLGFLEDIRRIGLCFYALYASTKNTFVRSPGWSAE